MNNLGAVLVPGGRYFVLCFNEREMRDGPRRVTKAEIRDTFRDGWSIKDIQETKFENLIHEGGASAWLATIMKEPVAIALFLNHPEKADAAWRMRCVTKLTMFERKNLE